LRAGPSPAVREKGFATSSSSPPALRERVAIAGSLSGERRVRVSRYQVLDPCTETLEKGTH
jgi:hypothetical protein